MHVCMYVCMYVCRVKVLTFCGHPDPVEEAAQPPSSVGLASCRQPHCADANGTVDLLRACGDWGRRGEEGKGE